MKKYITYRIIFLCAIILNSCNETEIKNDCSDFVGFTPQETIFEKKGGTVRLKTFGTSWWGFGRNVYENGISINLDHIDESDYIFDESNIIENKWISIKKVDEQTIEVAVKPLADDCMSMRSFYFYTTTGPCREIVQIIQNNNVNKE